MMRPVESIVLQPRFFSRNYVQRFIVYFEETVLSQILFFLRLVYRIFVALSLSVFLYFSFLHQYLLETNHIFPVNLIFDPCGEAKQQEKGQRCSILQGEVSLIDEAARSVLSVGQVYTITVQLEVPESDINFQVGMFMVCLKMFNESNDLIWPPISGKESESMDSGAGHCKSDSGHCKFDKEFGMCKSSMLRYKTHLFHFAETISRLPRLLFGIARENQMLQIEMESRFQENPYVATAKAQVSVKSYYLQIARASLNFDSEYTGMRHILSSYPIFIGSVCCLINFVFILLLMCLGDLANITSGFDPGFSMTSLDEVDPYLVLDQDDSDIED